MTATAPVQRHQRADHRRLLRADGARPVADSQPEQRHQFRPWRLPRHRRLYRLHDHALCRLLGRAADRAASDRADRACRRTRADPAALRARSALQPAAHLRPRLHHRGRHALHLGRAGQAVHGPAVPGAAAELRFLLHHRLSPVHGGDGRSSRSALLFVLLRYTRLGIRIRAGTLDLETVVGARHQRADAALAEFRRRHLSRRARAACSPPASSASSRRWAPAC